MKLKALAVAVVTTITLSGCSSSSQKTIGKDAFEDLANITAISSVSEVSMDVQFDSPGKLGLQGNLVVKSTKDCAQADLSNTTLKVYSSESSSDTFEVPNISALLDMSTKELYLSKDSMYGFMKTLGVTAEVADAADWISIEPEDIGLEVNLEELPELSNTSKYLHDIVLPKLNEVFEPIKSDLLSDDRHTIIVNSSNAATIVDLLLSMFEDGVVQELHDKALESGIDLTEQTISDAKSMLEDSKGYLSELTSSDSITITPTVTGVDRSRAATLAVKVSVDNSSMVMTLTLKEGEAHLAIPEDTMTYEEYLTALKAIYTAAEGT